MDIQLLAVPYDSGHRGARMGAGPEALLDSGLERELGECGHRTHVKIAELAGDAWLAEIQTGFDLMRMLSAAVREARDAGRLPVVLAGNCNTAVGTLAGLGMDSIGVAWFDAHGDFNTPETTASGFLDGTAVATITGRCWRRLVASIPGFSPIADQRVCLIGTRDLDALEAQVLDASDVEAIPPSQLRQNLPDALDRIRTEVQQMYVHIDLDVLDAAEARANSYALPGGLTLADAEYALAEIGRRFRIGGVTLSAYDPAEDPDGRAATAARQMILAAASASDAE